MSMEMNKALDLLREIRPSIPKEVLELWCKDRDAFLASHSAVEQAGGDERATLAHRSEFHQHLKECADEVATWPSYKREALTQPSPAPELERPEVVAYRTIGRHEKHQHPHYALNYYKQNAEDQAAHWRERGCEVSEDELMTVTQHARIVGALRAENTKLSEALDECDGDRWKLRSERDAANARLHEVATACATAEQQRSAALARAAELEKQEPVALANRGLHAFWVKWTEAAAGLYGPGIKLYAAPVAQAQQLNNLDKQCRDDVARALGLRPNQERGFAWSYLLASIKSCVKASGDSAQAQHSVPEEFIGRLSEFLAQRGATGKALLRELRTMLAAAPGKEGV